MSTLYLAYCQQCCVQFQVFTECGGALPINSITWGTSNANIATITTSGSSTSPYIIVTAIGAGNCTITANVSFSSPPIIVMESFPVTVALLSISANGSANAVGIFGGPNPINVTTANKTTPFFTVSSISTFNQSTQLLASSIYIDSTSDFGYSAAAPGNETVGLIEWEQVPANPISTYISVIAGPPQYITSPLICGSIQS
jgi:hypothetical protein